MKVLVTGAAGLVGTAIRRDLSRDHTVRLLIHNTPLNNPEGEVFQGSVEDYILVKRAMERMDAVVHVAIVPGKSPYWNNLEMQFNVNVRGTFNVCRAAVENRVKRLVYTSTGSIYACNKPTYNTPPSKGGPVFKEEVEPTPGPEYPYAITKYLAEKVVEIFAKGMDRKQEWIGLPSIILRLAGVIPAEEWSRLPENTYMATHVEDVAQAIRLAMENQTIKFDVFNVMGDFEDTNFPSWKAQKILGYKPRYGKRLD